MSLTAVAAVSITDVRELDYNYSYSELDTSELDCNCSYSELQSQVN